MPHQHTYFIRKELFIKIVNFAKKSYAQNAVGINRYSRICVLDSKCSNERIDDCDEEHKNKDDII